MEEIVKRFLEANPEERSKIYYIEIVKGNLMKEFHTCMKKLMKLRDRDERRYYYLLTFTLNPKLEVDETEDEIEKYIITRVKRKALKIVKAHIVKEYTKKGVAHWHVATKSKRYISKDRFKYFEKKYGFIDISKNHSQNYNFMMDYITKSNIPKEIILES